MITSITGQHRKFKFIQDSDGDLEQSSTMNKVLKMLRTRMYLSLLRSPGTEKRIVEGFHRLFYDLHVFGKTWKELSWLGVPVWKFPFELWVYQEILVETKPYLIIECGTAHGGSALFLASICDLLGKGRIITIDIAQKKSRPNHPRIQYLSGSSVAEKTINELRQQIDSQDINTMVILDSNHKKEHVLTELRLYSQFVTPGNYLIVEDTNLNGHPVEPDYGPGPLEAVEEFLKENQSFIVDKQKEKLLFTFNSSGYLRKA
jgi:cephalosporin hydroxylase